MFSINTPWMSEARALTGISVAVSITMFAQFAISAVETVIVARLGTEALAGVTLAISLDMIVFLLALGVVTALTPIVSAAFGRGDTEAVRLSGQQGLWVGLTFSVPGVLLLLVASTWLRTSSAPGTEASGAARYLLGSAWGLPAWVSYVAVRSLAIATGRVRMTTIIMLASLPVHAGLAYVLVYGRLGVPALGVFGAGLSYASRPTGRLACWR